MPRRRVKWSRSATIGGVAIETRVEGLARLLGDIEVALQRAERAIEADARQRIRTMHDEVKRGLAVLRILHRDASRLLSQLARVDIVSRDWLKRAADRKLTEARTVAEAMLHRLRWLADAEAAKRN